jgi:hypothetical protein
MSYQSYWGSGKSPGSDWWHPKESVNLGAFPIDTDEGAGKSRHD